jgi:hypothetical protein
VPRRKLACASTIAALVAAGCASTGSTSLITGSGSLTPLRPTSGYEVHEASEVADIDGLQMNLQHGFIRQEAAQDAIAARVGELTRCYSQAGAAVDFAAGVVTLRFVVDPRGDTSEVQVIESKLGNFEVERCLVSVGSTVRFPRPQGNAAATVEYDLEFRSTGAVPVQELPAGTLDAELPALHARLGAECKRLGADEVSVTLYVDAAGSVRSMGLASTETLDLEAASCLSAAVRRWRAHTGVVRDGVGRATVPVRTADLVAHRDSAEARRYARSAGRSTRTGRRPRPAR